MNLTDRNLSFRTPRLFCRLFERGDFLDWQSAQLGMAASKGLFDPGPRVASRQTRISFGQLLGQHRAEVASGSKFRLGIWHRTTLNLLGWVSIEEICRDVSQSAVIGYIVYNQYWGQGYGQEATAGLIRFSFTKLGLHRLEARIHPRNKPSIGLIKKMGFRKEGLAKGRLRVYGNNWCDMLIFAQTREEWK